jgi:hypothetical protein
MAYCGVDPNPGPGERGVTGTVLVHVVSPLEMPGAAISPVYINVFAQLVELSLAGPSPLVGFPLPLPGVPLVYGHAKGVDLQHEAPVFGRGGKVAKEEAQASKKEGAKRSEKGVISSMAKTAADVAGVVGMIPGLEPLALGAEGLRMVGKVAETLGLDQPPSQMALAPYRSQGRDAYTHGLAPVLLLTETPGSQVGGPEKVLKTDEVNPSFLALCKKPGLCKTFTFDTSSAVDALIAGWGVHPMVFPTFTSGASVCADPTPLAAITAGFAYWRGGLKYRVQLYAPSMSTCRLRICFLPDSTSPPASIEAYGGDVISKLVEVRGDTFIEFAVPFIYERLYSRVYPVSDRSASTIMLGDGTVAAAYVVGFIAIYLVAPVITYDAASTFITGQVWIAADDDYQLHQYVGRRGTTYYSSMPALASDSDPPPFAHPSLAGKLKEDARSEPLFGKSSSKPTGTAQAMISVFMPGPAFEKEFGTFLPAKRFKEDRLVSGDPPSAPHVLARRYVRLYSSNGGNVGALTNLAIPKTATAALAEASSRWITGNVVANWIHWICAAFRGFRGGLRVSMDYVGTSGASPLTTQPITTGTVRRAAVGLQTAVEITDHSPLWAAELPWEEINIYQSRAVENVIVSAADVPVEDLYTFSTTCTAAYTAISLVMWTAAADDLQLIDWLPPLPTLAA